MYRLIKCGKPPDRTWVAFVQNISRSDGAPWSGRRLVYHKLYGITFALRIVHLEKHPGALNIRPYSYHVRKHLCPLSGR